jgi:hypothetical protein
MAFAVNKLMSWANEANAENRKRALLPKVAPKPEKVAYKPPHKAMGTPLPTSVPANPIRGDVFGDRIFNGTRWVEAIDPQGDYGGPYWDMCHLFQDTRYRSDMLDIYGVAFQPSMAERCRDPAHLRRWRHVEEEFKRQHGHYPGQVSRPSRNSSRSSRNTRNSRKSSKSSKSSRSTRNRK